jgi:hypothetical protein
MFDVGQALSEKMLRQIERLYRALPLGSVVDGQVMIVHGGISNKTDLRELWTLDRFKVFIISSSQRINIDSRAARKTFSHKHF